MELLSEEYLPMTHVLMPALGLVAFILFIYLIRWIDSERLEAVSSSVQNFVVAASAIIAGLWAIYTFNALESREQALLDKENAIFAKEKAQTELNELRRQINETSSSTISLSTKFIPYKTPDPKSKTDMGLIVEVTITNKGNSKITYDLSESPLKIYKVEGSGDKLGYTELMNPVLYSKVAKLNQKDKKSIPLNKWVSLANSSRTLSYFVTVEDSSLYYVVFSSPGADEGDMTDEECGTIDKCNWFVSKYIYTDSVEESSKRLKN